MTLQANVFYNKLTERPEPLRCIRKGCSHRATENYQFTTGEKGKALALCNWHLKDELARSWKYVRRTSLWHLTNKFK